MKRTKPSRKIRTCTSNAWYPERMEEVYNYALLGYTNNDIAEAMGVAVATLEYWVRTKPEFKKSMRAGKKPADGKVVLSLFKCAVGYTYETEKIFVNRVNEYNDEGNIIKSYNTYDRIPVQMYKHPDVKAQIKWLNNRQPQNWLEATNVNIQGNMKITNAETIDLTDLTDEELILLENIGMNQMYKSIGNN